MRITEIDGKERATNRPSINLFSLGRRVVCLSNLSGYVENIKESFVEEKFPYIGKTYTISSCRLTTRKSLCFNLNLAEFEMEEDMMGVQMTLKSNWFVPEQVAYNVLLAYNIDIKRPGYKEKIQKIYDKGLWKPKKL